MIEPEGLRLHDPAVLIPWTASDADYARPVFGSPPSAYRSAYSARVEIPRSGTSLLPGVSGTLRVRLEPAGPDRWAVYQAVLYMRTRQRAAVDERVAGRLADVLGPPAVVPPLEDLRDGHGELRRWTTGPVTVSYGLFEEYSAYDDWQEEEVRIDVVTGG